MTIIVFLLDTSASMYHRTYLGTTLLDEAKGAVETFVKVRQRSPESRGDRYMLLSYEDPPRNVKAGWKENLATFMSELKNLRSENTTSLGSALKRTFDLLNINRMQTGIDTYGQGRNPFFLEPSMIIVITDGGRLTSATGVHDHLILPMDCAIPGAELTREPFRWDQRLFALVLRLPGTPVAERDVGLVPSDGSPIDAMCEVTGGRSYAVTSRRVLMQCVDSLVQKVHWGVVINFEKVGPDPPNVEPQGEGREAEGTVMVTRESGLVSKAWHSCRKLIYVSREVPRGFGVGFWPIPENYWPDLKSSELPPRTAHPNVKFSCLDLEPTVIENLPFDKYELEPSPLTQFILERKQPSTCWQVFVSDSSSVPHPFGYLKASAHLTRVNLVVMPYNYPVLLLLLEDLLKAQHKKPSDEWRVLFQNYLRAMPAYYAGPLRKALTRMGLPASLVPESLDNSLSFCVASYLKRLKTHAKAEFERICNDVATKRAASKPCEEIPIWPPRMENLANPRQQERCGSFRDQLSDFADFTASVQPPKDNQGELWSSKLYEVPREHLLGHLAKLRAAFYAGDSALLDEDRHTLPVSQMGNYQERLRALPAPLREVESAPVRQHLFGNPFKIDRRMMVDEADIDAGGGASARRGACALDPAGGDRRRSGPARRLPSRSPSPAPIAASAAPATVEPQPVPTPDALPALIPAIADLIPTIPAPIIDIPAPITDIPVPVHAPDVAMELSAAPKADRVLAEINGNNAASLDSEVRGLLDTEHNSKVRGILVKEIRRPGKNHVALSAALATLKGDSLAKRRVVADAIVEARRMKRRKLVELLEKFALDCCQPEVR